MASDSFFLPRTESMADDADMSASAARSDIEEEQEDDKVLVRPLSGEASLPQNIAPLHSPGEEIQGSWPRTFEQSMALYCGSRGVRSRRSRDLSNGVDSSEAVSIDSEPSFRPWVKHGVKQSSRLVSALTPLLSESNLVQLEQKEREQMKHREEVERRERESVEESDRETERERKEQGARGIAVKGQGHGPRGYMKVERVQSDESSRSATGAYEEVEMPPATRFAETTFNAVNMLLGVGILSTPYASSQGGWLGLLLLLFFAFVFFSTGIFLKDCLESRPNIFTYPDIGEIAFGQTGRWITAILLYIELYSVTVDLMILEGDNLSSLFPTASLNLGWIILRPNQVMLILTAICILPTVLLKDISFLSYLSACGVLASLLVVVAVGWIGVANGTVFSERGTLFRWTGIPVAIGMYSFCFSGHTVLPVIYCAMKDRSQFSKVLAVSFSISTILYASIAVMGYSMFGDDVQSQITLNLPTDSVMSKAAIWTTVVNPLTKFALLFTPLANSIEELFPQTLEAKSTKILHSGIRIVLVFSAMFVALSVPFFGFVMAFIGSFLGMSMSVIFPCACYIRLVGGKSSRWKMVSAYVFMIVGILLAIVGTYSSVSNILHGFDEPSPPVAGYT